MRSVTAEEMKRIELIAMQQLEIPELILVENAALGVLQHLDLSRRHSFAIFCGPGNNGADGLAVARHLIGLDKTVGIYLLGESAPHSEAWKLNMRALTHMKAPIRRLETLGDLDDMIRELEQYNTIIDALFGTGLNRELKEMAPIVIDNINQSRIFTISIDIPSGLDATTGQPYGAFIEANEIITMECMKKGLEHNPNIDAPVHLVSAGIPQSCIRQVLGSNVL